MLILDSYNPPEKYKEYKNRTIKKHMDKANQQLWQIKQCSLKKEDKEKLKLQMLNAITNFKL